MLIITARKLKRETVREFITVLPFQTKIASPRLSADRQARNDSVHHVCRHALSIPTMGGSRDEYNCRTLDRCPTDSCVQCGAAGWSARADLARRSREIVAGVKGMRSEKTSVADPQK